MNYSLLELCWLCRIDIIWGRDSSKIFLSQSTLFDCLLDREFGDIMCTSLSSIFLLALIFMLILVTKMWNWIFVEFLEFALLLLVL